jgi:predicted nuclease of restriction endonuclease-like (RecB) superfamily
MRKKNGHAARQSDGLPKKRLDAEFVQQAVAQIPWGHNVRILDHLKNNVEREWYIRQTVQNGWSRDVLVHHIEGNLYRGQGKAITNFDRTLPHPQSDLAHQVFCAFCDICG